MSRGENRTKLNTTTLRIRSFDDEEEEEDTESSKKGEVNPCFITVENDEGGLERLQFDLEDEQFTIQNPDYANGYPKGGMYPKLDVNTFYNPETKITCIADNEQKDLEEIPDPPKKTRKRIVAKGGQSNVEAFNIPKKKRLYVRDVFVTMVDSPWRFTLSAFAASFFITWLVFAGIYHLICWIHGDLDEENMGNENWTPCVWEIHNFASTFLFSVETQHTIGYGSRSTSEECPSAIIVMCLQSVIGVLSSSCMAGIVFAKLARPKYRTNTVIFSKNAVITMHNGALYLLFRVANIRKSHIIESHISAKLIHRKKVSKEGDVMNYYSEYIKVVATMEGGDEDRSFFMFPSTMIHKIDEDSPLYSMSPKDVLNAQFEMVVVLEGIVEPTGNSFQARSSYLPREILWGMRFENMVSYSMKQGRYKVDMSYLNAVIPDDTPRLSMEMIERQRRKKASHSFPPPRILSHARSQPIMKSNNGRFSPSIITIDGDIANRRISTIENSRESLDKIELDNRKKSLDSVLHKQNSSLHDYHAITLPVQEEINEHYD